jgi:hypothetical protein
VCQCLLSGGGDGRMGDLGLWRPTSWVSGGVFWENASNIFSVPTRYSILVELQ